jgi:hypothetical protein
LEYTIPLKQSIDNGPIKMPTTEMEVPNQTNWGGGEEQHNEHKDKEHEERTTP